MNLSRRDFLKVTSVATMASVVGVQADAACPLLDALGLGSGTGVVRSQLGWAVSDAVAQGKRASVTVLTADGQKSVLTQELGDEELSLITNAKSGQFVKAGSFVELQYDSAGQVVTIEFMFRPYDATGVWFERMKYGVEFSPANGRPGKMIASGWVLDKSARTVTIGDTNHFEETYRLSGSCKFYNINTESRTITQTSLDALPVTAKTNGKHSLTLNRQMAVVVFDQNYKLAPIARAVEVYYLTPQVTLASKYAIEEYDQMALYSCFPDTATGGVIEKPSSAPWVNYTHPFEIIPGRFWFVGDNDVAVFLWKTDAGLVTLDFGWPGCGYVYYQNIEDIGFDPREVRHLMLSHAHGDHYGSIVDYDKMLKNCGAEHWIYESWEDCTNMADQGFPEIPGTLTDLAVKSAITQYCHTLQPIDFGGMKVVPVLTPGHTVGCYSFVFYVDDGKGKTISFGYQGGMGTVHNESKGYLRHAFVYGLRFLQSNYVVDYQLPQHTAHFPILEINKACEIAGIPLLDGLLSSYDTWVNFLERRGVAQDVQHYHDTFAADPTITVQLRDGTTRQYQTQKAAAKLHSNEKYGPWKREEGTYEIQILDDENAIKLFHGFDVVENVNPKFAGIKNRDGFDMGNGFLITRDGYMHDPDKWYLQISMHVHDDYPGMFVDLTNGDNGPVESIYMEDWYEINRTEYFASRADAEKVMAQLKRGGTYRVRMSRSSYIQIGENVTDTLIPV